MTLAEAAPDAGQEALRFLASQGLPPTPDNYAFAWQIRLERHGLVAMAVDAILMDGRAVLPTDVARIMTAANPSTSPRDDDPQQNALRHQTLKLADLAAGAVATSSTFERDLSDKLFLLDAGPASTQRIVEAMIGRTQAVEAELRSASREIELLRQQVEVVRDDAQRDALTGLLNRRGAMHELSGSARTSSGVVALCDVDHFKSVNDRFGHGVGDRVLKGVALRIV
ncbi:MAG: diguanylate cyclase, partial [Lysobacteraceae bacterium]